MSSCLISLLVTLPIFALTSTNSNSNSASDNASPTESRIPIYRYYSSYRIDHYYTTDYTELHRGDNVYKYEGVGFYLGSHQNEFQNYIPLYQPFSHYDTTNPSQSVNPRKDFLGFCYPEKYEQVEMVPLYKYYQKKHIDHLYTTSKEEIGFNLKIGEFGDDDYEYQGIECYVFSSPGHSIIEDVSDLEEIPIIKEMHKHGELSKDIDFDINRQGDGLYMNISEGDDDLDQLDGGYYESDEIDRPVHTDGDIRNYWGVYAICGLFIFVGVTFVFTHCWCVKCSVSRKYIKETNEYDEFEM